MLIGIFLGRILKGVSSFDHNIRFHRVGTMFFFFFAFLHLCLPIIIRALFYINIRRVKIPYVCFPEMDDAEDVVD